MIIVNDSRKNKRNPTIDEIRLVFITILFVEKI